MVAAEGHLTRAAKRLHVSQPAVSAHIKSLEDELGVNLFIRTARGMVLTSDGHRLLGHAERVLGSVDEMIGVAERLRKNVSGKLRVGMNTEPESLRIADIFSIMKSRHPAVQLHLLQSMTGDIVEKLETGFLDVGFLYGDGNYEKIHVLGLQKLRLVVVGSEVWRSTLAKASPRNLGDLPWIMTPHDCPFHTVAERMFKDFGIEPEQVVLVDQESTLKTMIRAGVGISLLLARDVDGCREDNLAVWHRADLFLTLSVACLKRRKEEPLLQVFFSILSILWDDSP